MEIVDLTTAPREQVEAILTAQRDEIFFRIVRLIAQIATVNEQRFPLNPLHIDLNYSQQIGIYTAMPEERRAEVFAGAMAHLESIENPSRIITPDRFNNSGKRFH